MIVDDLDAMGVTVAPDEADPHTNIITSSVMPGR
jgi:hypothetical protein